MPKPITIVGGGLAGLALGIGLRQLGIPAIVWEAGHYPRHRLCGEFISGRGEEVLARLGLRDKIFEAGARLAQTAAFYSPYATVPAQALPKPAICVSRQILDALLAREFCNLGGTLMENQRWQKPFEEGIVQATGRRCRPVVKGWRWFGLKVHACNVPLQADLEVHLLPDGYVGLCRLAQNQVNICALFRSRAPIPDLAQTWPERLRGPAGFSMRGRMSNAVLDLDSFCSIAGLYLRPQKGQGREACLIGDALTMIAPVTGNGMSMAFESAAMAMVPLSQFSKGQIRWSEACDIIARDCDRTFAARLRWSAWLQWALLTPPAAKRLFILAKSWPGLWPVLFRRTR